MNEAFLILEISDSSNWPTRYVDCQQIADARRPTLLHLSRLSAEREALRLQQTHPGKRFALFHADSVTVTVQAPSHVNLKGEVLMSRPEARLADTTDQIPF